MNNGKSGWDLTMWQSIIRVLRLPQIEFYTTFKDPIVLTCQLYTKMTTINQIKRIWNWDKISAIQFEGKCVESSVPRKKDILCTILNTLTFQRPFIRQILKNTYVYCLPPK